jgi:hypothetical protein
MMQQGSQAVCLLPGYGAIAMVHKLMALALRCAMVIRELFPPRPSLLLHSHPSLTRLNR